MLTKVAKVLSLTNVIKRLAQTVVTAGVRLPSWDSSGFLLSDLTTYVRAVFPRSRPQQRPPRWEPIGLNGQ